MALPSFRGPSAASVFAAAVDTGTSAANNAVNTTTSAANDAGNAIATGASAAGGAVTTGGAAVGGAIGGSAGSFITNTSAATGNMIGDTGGAIGSMVANSPATASRIFTAMPMGGNIIRDLVVPNPFVANPFVPNPFVPTPAVPMQRTPYTQLAQNAIGLLRNASKDTLSEGLQVVRGKQIPGDGLVNWLERRTKVGEVLSQAASTWSAETIADFGLAFQMNPTRTAAMDVIVAIALLNSPDIEAELRSENTTAPTSGDLIQNRRVVYQYPPPGTPLQPPYVVLVAVEHTDTKKADDIVAAILGSLVVYQGYKVPREAAARLG